MYTLKVLVWLVLLLGAGGGLFWSQLRTADRRLLTPQPIVVAVALVACAMLVPNIWLLYAVLIAVLPLAARSRGEAVAIYLASFLALPTLSHHLTLGSAYLFLFTARDALSISLMLAMAVRPRSRLPEARRPLNDLAFLVFFAVLTLSAARGREPTDILRVVTERSLTFAIPYFCISRSIREPKDLRRTLLVLAMMGCALSVDGVFESRRNWHLMLTVDTRFSDGADFAFAQAMSALRAGLVRAAASFTEPISFSFFLAFAFLATMTLGDAFRSRFGQYAVATVIALGLYHTGSRGGWIATLVALLLLDVYRRRYASLGAKAVVIGVAGGLLVLAAQTSSVISERLGLSGHAEETADYRHQLFTRGIQEFHHAPILGRSPEAVYAAMADLTQGQHIVDFVDYWIYFLLVSGLVGTLIIAGAMLTPAIQAAAARRQLKDQRALLAIGGFLFAGALMPMGALAFSSFEDRYGLVWVTNFAMVAAFLPLARKGRPAASAGAPPPEPVPAPSLQPAG